MKMNEYRHEFKYPISDTEATILKQRLSNIMQLDPHVSKMGRYVISSLYFDDINDTCFYENENGTDPREKIRIRIYNHDDARISLECKRKERGKTLKTSCPIIAEQVKSILNNELITDRGNPLLDKFVKLQRTALLKPKIIVEYERVPYIYRLGNVRITFDSNLSSASAIDKFLDENYLKRPVLPKGIQLLEVKFDEFLPDFIYNVMQLGNFTQTAFSKYYLCRKYEIR